MAYAAVTCISLVLYELSSAVAATLSCMKRLLVLVSFGAVTILTGCSRGSSSNADRPVTLPKDLAISKPVFATQRFLPTNSPDLAFDTKTGSLCKTWSWTAASDQNYGRNLSFVTTCNQLYTWDVQDEERRMYEAKAYETKQHASK